MKEPWLEHPSIWKTKSSFMSFLRGGIRRALWNRSPIKLEFIKEKRIKIPNPNPRGKVAEVWGAQCALCGKYFPLNMMEVDHKTGNHSLNDLDDIQSFIENIVCISKEDLQFVDKTCHRIKSHADKHNMSFEDSRIEKEVIEIVKSKKDLTWLRDRGIVPAKNQKLRRQQILEEMRNELRNN